MLRLAWIVTGVPSRGAVSRRQWRVPSMCHVRWRRPALLRARRRDQHGQPALLYGPELLFVAGRSWHVSLSGIRKLP